MPTFDTIQEYEQAKENRFWDGAALSLCGYLGGSVYLLGYSIEIALKCAYFRTLQFPIFQPITRVELHTAKAQATLLGVSAPDESFHSVLFWGDLLRSRRAALGNPLQPHVERALLRHMRLVYDRWWVEMRYKKQYTTPLDLETTMTAADWFDRAYDDLWS